MKYYNVLKYIICEIFKSMKIFLPSKIHTISTGFGIKDFRISISKLAIDEMVREIQKMRFVKDKLCSTCEFWETSQDLLRIQEILIHKFAIFLLHKDLFGPISVQSLAGFLKNSHVYFGNTLKKQEKFC